MERFTEISRHIVEKIRDQFDNSEKVNRKKWFAYGVMLIVSVIMFLSLGGSKHRYPEVVPAGETEMLIGDTFQTMSDRLVGMGEPDQPGIYWEKVPEGIDPIYQTWGSDPFASRYQDRTTETSLKKSELCLSAISWRGDEAIILINDSILKEGDFVDGAEVLEIFSDSVILQRGDKEIVLNMSGGG